MSGRSVQGVVANAGDGGGDIDVRQLLAIGETTVANGFQALGQTHVVQSAAVFEGIVADRCHIVGNVDGLQRVAGVEGIVADGGKCGGQLDIAQAYTLAEHMSGQSGQASLGQCDEHQLGVVAEVAVTAEGKLRHVLGEGDGAQRVAGPESSVTKALDSGREGDVLDSVALAEGVLAYGLQSLGEGERGQHGIVVSFLADGLDGRRQNEAVEAEGVIESVGLNCLQISGERDCVQLLAAHACRPRYGGEVIGEMDCAE